MANINPIFDFRDPSFITNPYDQYEILRRNCPVCPTPSGSWLVTRHDAVVELLRSPQYSVDEGRLTGSISRTGSVGPGADIRTFDTPNLLNTDPPLHTRLRRAVAKAFTPRRLHRLTARVRLIIEDHIDKVEVGSDIDIIATLAARIPFEVISEILGLPSTHLEDFRSWTRQILKTLDPFVRAADLALIRESVLNLRSFVSEAIDMKRTALADDLTSELIASRNDRGDQIRTDEELLQQIILLYVAGYETTVGLIGNGLLALMQNRTQLELLRKHRGLVGNAVEEFVRYDSPVQVVRRIAREDVDIEGTKISAGDYLVAVLASANRDASRWGPNADVLDVTRSDAAAHVGFGGGLHSCLGAALARIEGAMTIQALIERFPDMDLVHEPIWSGRIALRTLDRLVVRLR